MGGWVCLPWVCRQTCLLLIKGQQGHSPNQKQRRKLSKAKLLPAEQIAISDGNVMKYFSIFQCHILAIHKQGG